MPAFFGPTSVKGEPAWTSRRVYMPLDSEAIVVEGNSVGTRMLVGRHVVQGGVPGGVNWAAARVAAR